MAVKVVVEGTDVMGSCVDPSLATSVDSCTAQMSMTVSAKDCSYPVIIIVDQAPLFTSPRVSPRSARLDLHAVIDIDCQTTLRNTKVLRLVFFSLLDRIREFLVHTCLQEHSRLHNDRYHQEVIGVVPISLNKSKMADGRHFAKTVKSLSLQPFDRF